MDKIKPLLSNWRSIFWPFTLAAAIAALVFKAGVPNNPEQLTVFIVLAVFGLLAWMIQNSESRGAADRAAIAERQHEIVNTQLKIALTLENHLVSISGHMENTARILEEIHSRLLDVGLRKD